MSALEALDMMLFAFVTSLPPQVTPISFPVTELMTNLQPWKNSFLSLGFNYAFLLCA